MAERDATTPTRVAGALAEFDSPDALVAAARKVREAGFKRFDSHTPFPLHDLDEAMGIPRTILPVMILVGGIAGLCTAIAMQAWMNGIDYPFVISGKPLLSKPAWVPIMFELTVLFSALTAFFGVLGLNWLPELYHWVLGSSRFKAATDAGFFLSIDANDPRFDKDGTPRFLTEAGAIGVELPEEPVKHAGMPRAFAWALVAVAIASWIPFAGAAAKRHLKSGIPPIQVFPDMDFQPKFKTQRANAFFADGRAMRLPVEGTIAMNQEYETTERTTGRFQGAVDGAYIQDFPVSLDEALVERGQDRFDIYCSPCHGMGGKGDGMVAKRAQELGAVWAQPSDLTGDVVQGQSIGQIFNTVSHGIRSMPGYAAQIPVNDRWAIIAYVRALGRTQHAAD